LLIFTILNPKYLHLCLKSTNKKIMKKNLLLIFSVFVAFISGYSQTELEKKAKKVNESNKIVSNNTKPDKKTRALRKKHASFLANSPFKKTLKMSEDERMSNGLPPNKYYEQEWELNMNPVTGRPDTDKLRALRDQLNNERKNMLATGRTPGDATTNSWIERGPNNVGGRTRAILFDPNDATGNTVIAGGISGGLWKNTNISSAASTWTRVNIPENLNVSCIQADPVTPTTFYVGTGESYTNGDAGGDGVWKSTNSGLTWTKVLGGISGPTTFQSAAYVTVNSPAGIAGNYSSFPTSPTNFGTAITVPITAPVILVNDGTAGNNATTGYPLSTEGCNPLTAGSLTGKIALIRRGTCAFAVKVKEAQNAGAIAVIMMNNIPGTPIPMGGTDATITIPSTMISQSDGDILATAAGAGTVNATLSPSTPGTITGNLVPGIQFVNDIAIRNNGGVSEIFVANGDSSSYGAYMGTSTYGVYKSVNGGSTWSLLNLPLTSLGNKHCPNDIAIGADNKIWIATTESTAFNDGGGKIFSSSDGGTTFVDKYTVTGNGGGARTQIEASSTNANKLYVLAQLNQATTTDVVEVTIVKTTDGFATATATTMPTGNGSAREVQYGFTGGQAFYDLMIKVDPSNDQIVYVGGIDLSRTADGGNSWTVISNWQVDVHSDQHAMAFKPGNSNIGLFGNDGGVFYSGSLSNTGVPATSRNNGFNVTQFYSVGVAPTGATGGNLVNDYFGAGAQDNGSQYFGSVAAGVQPSVKAQGGDGAFTMFDQGADKYYITNYVYNQSINRRTTAGGLKVINSETTSNGAFITPMELDSSLDILYTDYTAGTTYQIRRYSNVGLTGIISKTLLTNALLTSAPSTLKVSKYTTTSTNLLVGTRGGRLLKLTGANLAAASVVWTNITGPAFVGSVSDVEFGASENEIFVTMSNYNVTSIWYTSDGGVTWQNKEGNFPDIPVKCILQNPLNTSEVMVGTILGVWYTNNFTSASPTWNQSYNGMSNVQVTDMDLRNDNTVFAATYGRGIFSGVLTAIPLSIKENSLVSNAIKVYPTINDGNVTITATKLFGQTKLNLFDITGKNVFTSTINLDNIEQKINLGNLSSGNYILKLSGDDFEDTKRIIIE
jgi:hypothetical protein